MITGLNATRLKNHLLNPGTCKFLYSPSAQQVAKQMPELIMMTAPGVCSMHDWPVLTSPWRRLSTVQLDCSIRMLQSQLQRGLQQCT